MGSEFWQFDKFPLYRGRPLNKGLRDRDLNVLVFLCCTCVALTQSELSDSEVITFFLFLSLGHVSMKLNHTYTFKPCIKVIVLLSTSVADGKWRTPPWRWVAIRELSDWFIFKILHRTLTTVECSIGYSIYFSLTTIKRVFSFQIDLLWAKGPRFEGHDIVANSVIYVLTYKLTNIFSKEACFGLRLVTSSAWISGIRSNDRLAVWQARSVFCEGGYRCT